MRKVIDDLTIKTRIFEVIHEKFNYKLKNKNLLKIRDKIFWF